MNHTKIYVLECPKCRQLIYSRAVHDFHSCKCQYCFVDGGLEYLRAGFKGKEVPRTKYITVLATEKELYDDWNLGDDKFGWLDQEV